MFRLVSILLFASCLLGTVGTVHAAVGLDGGTRMINLAPHVQVLEDPTGALGLDQVRQHASGLRPSGVREDAAVNFGYSSSAWWLRIDLAVTPDAPRDWLLDVAFPTLDSVEYFGPDGARFATGDRLPFSQRPLLHRNFVFPVHLGEGATGTVWLRIVSEGTLTIPLRLWRHEAFWQESLSSYALLATYFGMLLALASYNLLLWISLRDRNYLSYVLFALAMAVGQLSLNGLGNQFLWPDWPAWGNMAFSTGFAATGFFGAVFTRGFLDTRRYLPRIDAAIIGLAGLFALCAIAPLVVPYRLAAIMTSLTGISFSLVAVLAGLRGWRTGRPGARVFLLAWTTLLLGVVVVGLRNLDLLPTNFLSFYAIQIGSAIEMVLLSFALAERINDLQREREAAEGEAVAAKRELQRSLAQAGEEVERRVADRTAELEAINAGLRERQRELQAASHADPLTGLANRLLLDARLEQAMQQARRGTGQIALLLLDLDRFATINERHGTAIGDEVLRAVASRLNAGVREVDTVARVDGDRFAIVLDSVGGSADAQSVAEKLLASLRDPMRVLGMPVECSAAIGIAVFGGGALKPGELLRRGERALRAAEDAGGNCWRMSSD